MEASVDLDPLGNPKWVSKATKELKARDLRKEPSIGVEAETSLVCDVMRCF